jgi:hypothetical protein
MPPLGTLLPQVGRLAKLAYFNAYCPSISSIFPPESGTLQGLTLAWIPRIHGFGERACRAAPLKEIEMYVAHGLTKLARQLIDEHEYRAEATDRCTEAAASRRSGSRTCTGTSPCRPRKGRGHDVITTISGDDKSYILLQASTKIESTKIAIL